MSKFSIKETTDWKGIPGLYAAINTQGKLALDQDNREASQGQSQGIHGWSYGGSFNISNKNQLWQFADIGEGKWLIINKYSGDYLAAPQDNSPVVPQRGNADDTSAHWRIDYVNASANLKEIRFFSVNFSGSCLTLFDGDKTNGTKIHCATQNSEKDGQVWCVKKQN